MTEQAPHFSKTRLAPTPSGFLHLGNVLSFAITAGIAAKTGAKILLRIDDLDRDRVNSEYVQDIFDSLSFLEIPWDEGPLNYNEYESEYSQLHRMDLYRAALLQLKDSGQVFACTCSRAQLRRNNTDDIYPGTCRDKAIPLDAKDVSWRLKTDSAKEIQVNTLQEGLIKTTLPANMQDFIVRKKDGFPAYQLTSVIDDLHFGVDLIVRGHDLWPSTLAQIYLSSLLTSNDFQDCTFYHHALLTEASGIKLSKSAGDTSVKYLRELGKKPTDVYSEIAGMLGFKETIADWRQLAGLIG
ncbi:MAG TPA: glutamate--tRNA ligase family protein [Mucilaginibacter sp.]|jgi:glutamyl-tRNA synthetase|nr:glutamate--tRNA ligase family protein [Mucilaginibacter sp.]